MISKNDNQQDQEKKQLPEITVEELATALETTLANLDEDKGVKLNVIAC
jgi:hypothetical protein